MGIIFAFLAAISTSLYDALSKKVLKDINEYTVSWIVRFSAFILMIPVIFFTGIPSVKSGFWTALIISGTLNVFTTVFYLKSIKSFDLSICTPMLTFTPLFLLITSHLILNESTGFYGSIGVILIALGSYFLNIRALKDGIFSPFVMLVKNKGTRLMLLVALIYSITSNYDKIGVQNSSPLFWIIAVNAYISILLLPIMIRTLRTSKTQFINVKTIIKTIPVAMVNLSALIFQMIAINLTLVSYVISIKRTSAIFSVILGFLFFKEKGIKERLLGVITMVLGVICITVFSR